MRSRFGDDILAKVVVSDALAATEPLVVIDTCYLVEHETCQVLPNFYLLNITAQVECGLNVRDCGRRKPTKLVCLY